MHRVFQNYVGRLLSAQDFATLGDAMGDTAAALDLLCFAYLSVPHRHEVAEFGIRYGFTIPIHDKRGPIAAIG